MYSHRPTIPTLPSRFHELLDALKTEYEAALQDFGAYKIQREDFEHKIQLQINEVSLLQKNFYELERTHNKIKQQYEEEIHRLRKELSGSSPSENRGSYVPLPQLPLPPNLSNSSASTGLSNLESNLTSAPLAKRIKSDETLPAALQKAPVKKDEPPATAIPPIDSQPSQKSGSVKSEEEVEQVPSVAKKEGYDWLIVYNPKATRAINIDLMHNLEHQSVVCCVRFSADGKYLATGSNHLTHLFDVATGTKICTLSEESEKEGDLYIRSVCFSPDGRTLVTGAEDKIIRVWDIEKKEVIHRLVGHEQDIYALDYACNGEFIVSGSGDHTAIVWDPITGDSRLVLKTDDSANKECGITSVAISPDCKLIITGSLDQFIRVWDAKTGELIEKVEGHKNSVYSVAFAPDGKSFVSGSLDKTLKIWEIGTRGNPIICKNTISGHKDFVLSVAYSPDDRWIISGSKDRSVQFWDCQTSTTQLMLQGHKNSVISVALSPAGGMFATGSGDFRARIWSFSSITK